MAEIEEANWMQGFWGGGCNNWNLLVILVEAKPVNPVVNRLPSATKWQLHF